MKVDSLDRMTRGWFIGDFEPNTFFTQSCEVAIKQYKKGEQEECHFHKAATEITAVVSGEIKMCNQVFRAGDIVSLAPLEETAFEALTDAILVVVKLPAAKQDKYFSSKTA